MCCFFFPPPLWCFGQRDGETGEMGELESSSSEGEKREAMGRERLLRNEINRPASQIDASVDQL